MDKIISEFLSLSTQYNQFQNLQEASFEEPIEKGKWTVKEIISHLYRWDLFLLKEAIQTVKQDNIINFPDHDKYNSESEQFAKTLTIEALLKLAEETRKILVQELNNHQDLLQNPIVINGITHCPRTNQPYTLHYIIGEFVEHDHHHLNQIKTLFT